MKIFQFVIACLIAILFNLTVTVKVFPGPHTSIIMSFFVGIIFGAFGAYESTR